MAIRDRMNAIRPEGEGEGAQALPTALLVDDAIASMLQYAVARRAEKQKRGPAPPAGRPSRAGLPPGPVTGPAGGHRGPGTKEPGGQLVWCWWAAACLPLVAAVVAAVLYQFIKFG